MHSEWRMNDEKMEKSAGAVADGSDGDFSGDHGDDDAVLLVLLGCRCRVTVVVMAMTAVMIW